MGRTKILVVEDEAIIAENICSQLNELGYDCPEPCGDYTEAIAMLRSEEPDLAMLDINLSGKKDGIDIARYIRNNLSMPFIFLTANSDPATVERAKATDPNAYLVKPFSKAHLYTAVEIALHNFNKNQQRTKVQEKQLLQTALFIKEGEYFHKVNFDDILYLSSEHVYVAIHTTQKKILVRAVMQEYVDNLDPVKFVRVHRSYVANVDKIEKINSQHVIINGEEIPISKNYLEQVLRILKITRSDRS